MESYCVGKFDSSIVSLMPWTSLYRPPVVDRCHFLCDYFPTFSHRYKINYPRLPYMSYIPILRCILYVFYLVYRHLFNLLIFI